MLVDFICLVIRYVVVIVDWDYFNFSCHWNLSHTPKFIGVIWFLNSQQLMPIVGKMSNLVKWTSWVQIGSSKSSLQAMILHVEDKDANNFDITEVCRGIEGLSCDGQLSWQKQRSSRWQTRQRVLLCYASEIRFWGIFQGMLPERQCGLGWSYYIRQNIWLINCFWNNNSTYLWWYSLNIAIDII